MTSEWSFKNKYCQFYSPDRPDDGRRVVG